MNVKSMFCSRRWIFLVVCHVLQDHCIRISLLSRPKKIKKILCNLEHKMAALLSRLSDCCCTEGGSGEQNISKDLPVPAPQINRTPFLVSPVELTCVDGLLHVNGAVRAQHLLVVGQTGIHLKVGEADPQERRHGCGFIIPDLCRYAGDAAMTQPRGFSRVFFADGFSVDVSCLSSATAHANWLLFSFRGETGWQGRRRGLAASRPRRPKRPDGGRDEVRETSSSQRNHRRQFPCRLLPPRCSSVGFTLNTLTKCLLAWTKPKSLSGIRV